MDHHKIFPDPALGVSLVSKGHSFTMLPNIYEVHGKTKIESLRNCIQANYPSNRHIKTMLVYRDLKYENLNILD